MKSVDHFSNHGDKNRKNVEDFIYFALNMLKVFVCLYFRLFFFFPNLPEGACAHWGDRKSEKVLPMVDSYAHSFFIFLSFSDFGHVFQASRSRTQTL